MDLAENAGESNIKKFKSSLSWDDFFYWKARKDLYLTSLHRKEEYYYANIARSSLAAAGVEPGPITDYLIDFKYKTPKDIEDDKENHDESFMNGLHGVLKKCSLNRVI